MAVATLLVRIPATPESSPQYLPGAFRRLKRGPCLSFSEVEFAE